jgi:signal transduction histidine kinase/integral membrane sensor domain MASE1
MKRQRNRSQLIELLILVVAYYAAGKLGLSLARNHPSASVVWPPTGIAIAAMLSFRWRVWPVIFAGAFLVNITTAGNVATSLAIAAGNTLEAVVAVYLLRRFAHGQHAFERVRDAFAFIFMAAIVSTTVSATIGVASLTLGGFAQWENFGAIWITWWLGNAVGAAVITPLILAWRARSPLDWTRGKTLGVCAVFAALVIVSEAIFGGFLWHIGSSHSLPFLAIPILVWIGLRFGLRETASALFLMAVIAVSSVVYGVGPFVTGSPHLSLISLQAFLGVVSIIAIVIAAEIAERRSAEKRLDVQQATARILGEATSLRAAIPLILATIGEKLRWDVGAFWSIAEKTDRAECMHVWVAAPLASSAADFIAASENTPFDWGKGRPGQAWESGRITWIDDIATEPHFSRAAAAERAGLCTAFAFPARLQDGLHGIIEFFSREARPSDEALLALLEVLGSQIGLLVERADAKAELEQRKAEAEAANKAKDNFLAMLSHELRTPLTPIMSAVDQLEETLPPDSENRELAATIRRNVAMESRLIDDLLDVTRLGQGKIELRRRAIDAHQSIEEAITLCRSASGARKIQVQTNLAAARHWVNADPMRLQQIIWNLVQNAVKFSSDGTVTTVTSANLADGERLEIQVADQGVGIERHFLERVFEPFIQAKSVLSRRYGGLGLGLAISRSLAAMHEGTLAAESSGLNQGATFTLSLRAIEKPADSASPKVPLQIGTDRERSLRILLVDDHADTRQGLERLLRRRGHYVQSAEGVEAALNIAALGAFDLLISDLGLPDGSGHDLMMRFPQRHAIKAIAISGFGMDGDVEKSKSSGFSEHLLKPIEFARLDAIIQRLAGEK